MEIFDNIASDYGTYLILFTVFGIIISIYSNWLTPAQAFLSSTLFLIIIGIVEVEDFLVSFSNKEVITIFILIFITVAIRIHVDVNSTFNKYFPQGLNQRQFVLKLSVVVAFFSSFLNNTPIVSMLTSNVQNWAGRKNISPSKFLIPLSYAAMLGGMITVIGTSTNLVLMALLSSNDEPLLHILDFLVVGSVVAFFGIVYLVVFSDKLLPDRKIAIKQFEDNLGEYVHEVELEENNNLVGKSVHDAGLKNLEGIYLVEISRNGELITPVPPNTIVQQNDHLYIAGDTELVVEFVRKKSGLMFSSEEKLEKVGEGNIVEVVIAPNSKLSGILVKDSDFREYYNASILGIHRNGEKVSGKIGHLKMRSGDLLLLLTGSDFQNRISNDKNLYLLSQFSKIFSKPVVKRKYLYLTLQLILVFLVIVNWLTYFMGLLISLFMLVLFKYLNIDTIKKNFNFDLLIVLACSLTIGKAFIDTGTAALISNFFLNIVSDGSLKITLISLFIFTTILTSLITNVAAISIAFPIAFALSHQLNVDGSPFYLTIAFAASAAFLTPMAYQTNMMVYGPGGYKSIDFLKAGMPLLILYMISSLFTIFWWFKI